MKHLLITLSILLLSSPVIGEETGVLYLYETSTGIKWKTLGVGQVQPKYEGEITDGKPNGKGIETFPNGEKYVGEFKDGEYHGQGIYTWKDGRKYVGKVKDGECHGQGTFSSKDGETFVGEWKDDEEWNIKEYDKNGNITGKWVNGVKQK